ncbi:MAG: hypothetical protein PVH91_12950 [Pseudomonadales bacterium]|jgi:hypothetical protein
MKFKPLWAASAFVTGVTLGITSQAQALTCSELKFTGDVVSQYPSASEFCNDVAMREGKPYAHFIGEVTRVRGGTVYLKFKRPDGTFGDPVSITPPAGFRVKIAGRSYSVRSLNPRQELSIYIPQDQWALVQSETPEELASATTVTSVPIEPADEGGYVAAATLPDTASPWPALGLAGAGLLALGGAAGWLRRRLAR